MTWGETVIVTDSIAAILIASLIYFTIRTKNKTAPEWALLALFIGQLAWIVSDGVAVFIGLNFGIFSSLNGGLTGLSIILTTIAAYLFCEFYPYGPPLKHFKIRLSLLLLSSAVFCWGVFTPLWVHSRRVENGIKVAEQGPLFIAFISWVVLVVVAGLIILYFKQRKLRDLRIKKNIRVFTLGILLNLALSTLTSALLPLYGVYELDFIGPVSALVFFSFLLFTLSFYGLINLEAVALRLLGHTVIVLAGGLLSAGVLYLILGKSTTLFVWFFFAVMFLTGVLYNQFLKPRVNRFFPGSKPRVQQVLLDILSGRAFDMRDINLEQLLDELLKTLCETLGVSRGLLLAPGRPEEAHAKRGDLQQFLSSLPMGFLGLLGQYRLPENFLKRFDGIFLLERGQRDVFSFETMAGESESYPRVMRNLYGILDGARNEGFQIFVPLILNNKSCGYLLLGEKDTKKPYYQEDLELLRGIRTSIALAIRNYKYYEEIRRMKSRAETEVDKLTAYISGREATQRSIHGRTMLYTSPQMEAVMEKCDGAAKISHPVLIQGETGTGKELIARIIHEKGRPQSPFVAVNCAAIPSALWEDEIFGHIKGAFTDARRDRAGFIREAAGGTLFFDEIGEMPLEMQSKMLRLLQERVFRPVGGTKSLEVECRFIFATNKNLEKMITAGGFRDDLYYRVNVFSVLLPPLRERPIDIPILVKHYLEKLALELDSPVKSISAQAMESLSKYSWPGNIRELENLMIRTLAATRTEILGIEDLPVLNPQQNETSALMPEKAPLQGNYKELVDGYRKNLILKALKKTGGNKTKAAEYLGVKRTTFNSQLRELGL